MSLIFYREFFLTQKRFENSYLGQRTLVILFFFCTETFPRPTSVEIFVYSLPDALSPNILALNIFAHTLSVDK